MGFITRDSLHIDKMQTIKSRCGENVNVQGCT